LIIWRGLNGKENPQDELGGQTFGFYVRHGMTVENINCRSEEGKSDNFLTVGGNKYINGSVAYKRFG